MNTDTQNSISEAEETRRGLLLVQILNLKEARQTTAQGSLHFDPPRYSTDWGTKTALGVYRIVANVVQSGN